MRRIHAFLLVALLGLSSAAFSSHTPASVCELLFRDSESLPAYNYACHRVE